jgi:dihydrofolate reductase
MGKIVAGLFISLDGVIESPDKWHFPYFNDEMGAEVGTQMAASSAMLLGRVTYQEFAGYWPNADPNDPITAYMNNAKKYVVSTTLDSAEWQNSTLITGDVMEQIAALKQQPDTNLGITGSATLVYSLLQNDLLDELRLLVHPVVVGSGKRLFKEGDLKRLQLVESKTFSTGVVSLVYQPAPAE